MHQVLGHTYGLFYRLAAKPSEKLDRLNKGRMASILLHFEVQIDCAHAMKKGISQTNMQVKNQLVKYIELQQNVCRKYK